MFLSQEDIPPRNNENNFIQKILTLFYLINIRLLTTNINFCG